MRNENGLFTPGMLAKATLEPWETEMARKGVCPKCSDTLKDVSAEGLRAAQCLGCSHVFILECSAESGAQPVEQTPVSH